MFIKPELDRWLNQTRPASVAVQSDHSYHWQAQPALAQLRMQLDAMSRPDAKLVTRLVDGLFADTTWIDHWVDKMAAAAIANPFFAPPLAPLTNGYHVGLQIFIHRYVRMSIGVLSIDTLSKKKSEATGPRAITFTGIVAVQKFIRSGQAQLRMWDAPEARADFSTTTAGCCKAGAELQVEDGQTLVLDGRHESYVIEQASSDIVILQAEVLLGQGPLLIEYDAEALYPVAASSTDDGASRSQMMLSFLGRLSRPDDAAVIKRFTRDPLFFVRWHAMSELLAADPNEALAELQHMVIADDHAEIRANAAAVLSAFSKCATSNTGGPGPCHI